MNDRFLVAFIATLALVSAPLRAQRAGESERDALPAFSSIVLGGDFNTEIRYGKQFQARLDVEELFSEYVLFAVEDSTLTVAFEDRKVPMDVRKLLRDRDGKPAFRVIVTMPEYLRTLELRDRAVLLSADDLVVAPGGLEIRATGDSRISSFSVGTSKVVLDVDRKADVKVKVSSDSLRVRVGGNAILDLEQHALASSIELSGSANLVLSGSSKSMDLHAKGTSKSILNGVVPRAQYQVSGIANVNAVNLESDEARVSMGGLCTLVEAASESLYVDISAGATLSFVNEPAIHILQVKNATFVPYESK